MEQVQRHLRRLGIESVNVGVVARCRGHLLLLVLFLHRVQQVPERRRFFKSRRIRSRAHPLPQFACQVVQPPFQKQPHVRDLSAVGRAGRQPLHARPQAAMDVELQTRLRVSARQVHLARRDFEMAVDELHQPVGQVARKIRAVVRRAVLLHAPRHVHPRPALRGQLDVGIGLVVAQQHVEARLVLFDQVALERQRFLLVVQQDVVEVRGFADQAAGLGLGQPLFVEVAPHPRAQALGLAHVQHGARVILVQIHARPGRKLRSLVAELFD